MKELLELAIKEVKGLFAEDSPVPPVPPGLTLEALWAQVHRTKTRKPSVEQAVKVLLEKPELETVPIAVLAEVIKEVFKAYGVNCRCSESSVRWYQSQRGMDWKIIKRRSPFD